MKKRPPDFKTSPDPRKRVGQNSGEAVKKTMDLMDNLSIGIAVSTPGPEGTFVETNTAMVKMFGYGSKEEFLKVLTSDHYADPEERGRFSDLCEQGPVKNYETRFKRKDGTLFWGSIQSIPWRSDSGEVQRLKVLEDITERKEHEKHFRRQQEELAAKNRIIQSIFQSFDLDERLNYILDEVMAFSGVEMGGVYLMEEQGVVLRTWRGVSDDLLAHARYIPRDKIPVELQKARLVSEHLTERGVIPDFAKHEGIQTVAVLPLDDPLESNDKNILVGTLIIGCKRYEALDKSEFKVLIELSYQMALAIKHVYLYHSARKRLARLQVLHEIDKAIIMQKSIEDTLKTVLISIPKELGAEAVAVSLLNGDERRPEIFAMRLPNGTVIDKQVFDLSENLLHWLLERKEPVVIYDLAQDPRVQMHLEHIRVNRLASYLGVPMLSQDKAVGILHILTTHPTTFQSEDMAFFTTLAGQAAIAIDNVRMQKKLKTSEAKYRVLAENAPDIIYNIQLSPEVNFQYISPSVTLLTGYRPEEFYTNPGLFLKISSPDDRDIIEAVIQGKVSFDAPFTVRWLKKNGDLIWIEHHITPVFDSSGKLTAINGIARDVTGREQAKKALLQSEQRFKLATEGINAGIWSWNVVTGQEWWSPKFYELLGYENNEIEASVKQFEALLHPDEVKSTFDLVDAHFKFGGPFITEYRLRKKSGEYAWFLGSGQAQFDTDGNPVKMVGSIIDISERKEQEKLIKDQIKTLSSLYEGARRLAEKLDIQTIAEGIVKNCVKVLGARLAWIGRALSDGSLEVLTHYPHDIDYPRTVRVRWDDTPEGQGPSGRAVRTRSPQITENIAKDPRFVLWRENAQTEGLVTSAAFPMTCRGEVFGCLNIYSTQSGFFTQERVALFEALAYHDASALENARLYEELQKRAMGLEQKVIERTVELQTAKEAAEAATRAKSIFLANMSHEIRTPLNAILGFAQLLQRDPILTPRQRKDVEIINRSGTHLLRLINDILDISKIEAGHVIINPTIFSLTDLIDDLELMFRSRTDAKGLRLQVERGKKLPHHIRADEGKLRQVFTNIIGNAVKFTQEGGVVLRVKAEKAKKRESEVRLTVEVEDTGPGISEEEQGRLFEPFEQTAAGAKSGGTGLGLAISRRLVEMMGGTITVESEVGRGSTFRFDVLAREVEAKAIKKKKKEKPRRVTGLAPGTGPIRALVVDDVEDNRTLLAALLKPTGFEVEEAVNGRKALEVSKRWSPDVIFMDIRMPVMDGYEATRRLKNGEGGKPVPVIAVTASILGEAEKKVKQAGADTYISKPYQEWEVFSALSQVLGLRYVYADEERGEPSIASKSAALRSEAVTSLPRDLVIALRAALEEGDMERFMDLVGQMEEVTPDIAEKIRALAEEYDYEALSKILEK